MFTLLTTPTLTNAAYSSRPVLSQGCASTLPAMQSPCPYLLYGSHLETSSCLHSPPSPPPCPKLLQWSSTEFLSPCQSTIFPSAAWWGFLSCKYDQFFWMVSRFFIFPSIKSEFLHMASRTSHDQDPYEGTCLRVSGFFPGSFLRLTAAWGYGRVLLIKVHRAKLIEDIQLVLIKWMINLNSQGKLE